ncbi:hypothetical protein VNO77_30900 [Canavalia gladiata]|uniref:Uncharacterized protein n=1 Tax=Canavalia gladiata TaxID=3824 RepID=A0AAN9KNG3_CANGL
MLLEANSTSDQYGRSLNHDKIEEFSWLFFSNTIRYPRPMAFVAEGADQKRPFVMLVREFTMNLVLVAHGKTRSMPCKTRFSDGDSDHKTMQTTDLNLIM